jgi:hypothetical protein
MTMRPPQKKTRLLSENQMHSQILHEFFTHAGY